MNNIRLTLMLLALVLVGVLVYAAYRTTGNEGEPPPNAVRVSTNPDWYEAYRIAQGYRIGNLIFLSGQASLDETGAVVGAGDFDAQAAQTFENLRKVLEAAGSGLDKVIKVNVYLTDMRNFPKIVKLREKYFSPPYPADTIVEVRSLALPELLIEVEAVALAEGTIIDPKADR